MGSISVVILYLILLIRCLRSAWRASDEFGRMLALGISTLLFCHIFINIAMTIGLLPITGLPLPLMSYGGSFMISWFRWVLFKAYTSVAKSDKRN